MEPGHLTGEADDYGEGAIYAGTVYPDGSPLPPHTYDYVHYDEVGDDFLLLKGQPELGPNVNAGAISHLFNVDTFTWRSGPNQTSAILNSGGITSWDAKRRLLLGHSGHDGGGKGFVAFYADGMNPDCSVGMARQFSLRSASPQAWTGLGTQPPSLVITSIERILSAGFGLLNSRTSIWLS